jgi:hypothetical protein
VCLILAERRGGRVGLLALGAGHAGHHLHRPAPAGGEGRDWGGAGGGGHHRHSPGGGGLPAALCRTPGTDVQEIPVSFLIISFTIWSDSFICSKVKNITD